MVVILCLHERGEEIVKINYYFIEELGQGHIAQLSFHKSLKVLKYICQENSQRGYSFSFRSAIIGTYRRGRQWE